MKDDSPSPVNGKHGFSNMHFEITRLKVLQEMLYCSLLYIKLSSYCRVYSGQYLYRYGVCEHVFKQMMNGLSRLSRLIKSSAPISCEYP